MYAGPKLAESGAMGAHFNDKSRENHMDSWINSYGGGTATKTDKKDATHTDFFFFAPFENIYTNLYGIQWSEIESEEGEAIIPYMNGAMWVYAVFIGPEVDNIVYVNRGAK